MNLEKLPTKLHRSTKTTRSRSCFPPCIVILTGFVLNPISSISQHIQLKWSVKSKQKVKENKHVRRRWSKGCRCCGMWSECSGHAISQLGWLELHSRNQGLPHAIWPDAWGSVDSIVATLLAQVRVPKSVAFTRKSRTHSCGEWIVLVAFVLVRDWGHALVCYLFHSCLLGRTQEQSD